MAILDPIKPTILATRVIPNVDRALAAKLGLRDDQRSVALVTCDIDDSLYVSLDEATKMADVEVVYAHSFYAGLGARLRPAVRGDHRHPGGTRPGRGAGQAWPRASTMRPDRPGSMPPTRPATLHSSPTRSRASAAT